MTLFYGILLLLTLTTLALLAVWDLWRNTKPDEWVAEDDERRTPNWRRI